MERHHAPLIKETRMYSLIDSTFIRKNANTLIFSHFVHINVVFDVREPCIEELVALFDLPGTRRMRVDYEFKY